MHPGKKAAGEYAASFVESGMKVGLGTGSTAYYAIKKLGERVRGGLVITGYPTSRATEALAREEGIPLGDLTKVDRLDVTIDGADEFDPQLDLIKGGGGALFREKVVASLSDTFLVVVDDAKKVDTLGAFALPVEVVPFAWEITQRRIEALGVRTTLRQSDNQPFVTDNANYILDCHFGTIEHPARLHATLIDLIGVVETGLFIQMADKVMVGYQNGDIEEIVK
ncbi:MAG: ribose-5-phosphate isomerase RpiA [Bacteroidota bacterium]